MGSPARALLVGEPEDLAAVLPYEHDVPEISDRVRQQAPLTEQAIRERANNRTLRKLTPKSA